MPASDPVLRVSDVRDRHDGTERATRDGVGFELAAGEVVLLLDPSGSGRSTLALALNGLISHAVRRPWRARCWWAGWARPTAPSRR